LLLNITFHKIRLKQSMIQAIASIIVHHRSHLKVDWCMHIAVCCTPHRIN
jgi:hypothetical protein